MAFALQVTDSSDLNLYAGGFWTFFNNEQPCDGDCQSHAVYIRNTSRMFYFGINTHLVSTLVYDDGVGIASHSSNTGGWGGAVAAYLLHSE
jgi:glucan 1,3-beta-glucosidase